MIDFSIITVNYNGVEGLGKTIHSVISQNYRNYEYIVIDGGSTDGSKQLIEQNRKNITFWC
jgi:glycosyltransferase involved in cell wall biosynthesis